MQEKKKFSKSELYRLFDSVGGDIESRYDTLLGQLLTTAEATIEGKSQAQALKQRMKAIQGRAFEDLNQALWGFHNYMSEKDKIENPQAVNDQMQKMIATYIAEYERRLANLVGAIVVDERRLACLKREIKSLVLTVSAYMRNAVLRQSKVIQEQQA
ncbi:MAG: hypothetical protein E3J60_04480 [Dehalococcoidia bacterium]|nr:MAG: hypothetical protein E3J60_04480 [Dehalococcoidia bacterium]